jgi:hypothetical protein
VELIYLCPESLSGSALPPAGCAVMETVLNTAVPRFLHQIAADYQLWAAGGNEDSRQSMALESSLSFSEEEDEAAGSSDRAAA